MMQTAICLLVAWVVGFANVGWAGDAPPAAGAKTRVLIVTGGHDFEQEPFLAMFKANPQIVFEAVEHPKAHARLGAEAARGYDVLVLYDMWQPISPEAKADFLARIKEGKGLVALHHCLASYQAWPEYQRIVGGKYHLEKRTQAGLEKPASTYKHDVDFQVRIAAPDHPVTRGLKDFAIHDETYGLLEVDPGSRVLLKTDEPTSNPVIGWAREEGRARAVYLQLGHDHVAYENPNYRQLLAQAIRWAAGKSDPNPAAK
jgi:type 1 glutamine amidotransferase